MSVSQNFSQNRTQRRKNLVVFTWFLLIAATGSVGCSTPFMATDNEFLLKLPGTERRSDKIEGVLRPWERRELIAEKGEKGARAKKEEKDILVFQLMEEYKKSNDPSIRRSAIEALGKITATADIAVALPFLNDALRDETLGVRVSAADALGNYAKNAPKKERNRDSRSHAARYLALRYAELPYSVDAGEKKENEERKDLRLALIRNLAQFEDAPEILAALGEALDGEKLDDGALRLASMKALGQVTGKRYGLDYALWRQYLDYRNGSAVEPAEVSPLADLSLGALNPLK